MITQADLEKYQITQDPLTLKVYVTAPDGKEIMSILMQSRYTQEELRSMLPGYIGMGASGR